MASEALNPSIYVENEQIQKRQIRNDKRQKRKIWTKGTGQASINNKEEDRQK